MRYFWITLAKYQFEGLNMFQGNVVRFLINSKNQALFAILSLCVILVLDASIFLFLPYSGATIGIGDSRITKIDHGGPAGLAGLMVGDQVLKVNGKSVDKYGRWPTLSHRVMGGDLLIYTIRRENQTLEFPLTIGNLWDNPTIFIPLLALLFFTIVFWVLGALLCIFVPREDIRARLIGLFWILGGVALAAGGPGAASKFWGARTIMKVSWCMLSLVGITAHLFYPTVSFSEHCRKRIINTLFFISGFLALLCIVDDVFLEFFLASIGTAIFVYAFFFVSMVTSILFLLRNVFAAKDLNVRRQTLIILWGTILGLAPFLLFTLLPVILHLEGFIYIEAPYSLLFLVLMPLAYVYVIHQRRLLRIDFIINRAVVLFVLMLFILLVTFLTLSTLASILDLPPQLPMLGGVMTALLVLPSGVVQSNVQRRVNQILYGAHYDHATVAGSLSSQLAQTMDRVALTRLLTQSLAQQMGIQQTALLLASGNHLDQQVDGNFTIYLDDEICITLLDSRKPMRIQRLMNLNSSNNLERWQGLMWGQIFAPIVYENRLLGILILGNRIAGDVYSDQDMVIIATVARQSAMAMANIQLVEDLRGLAQQLVRSEEAHRRKVARDLHDVALQSLFFIKQKLLHEAPGLADFLDQAIAALRQTIKIQRPSLLDHGISLALQDLVENMCKLAGANGPMITWKSKMDELTITDEVATSIYRIAQESITNALKHASARHIIVSLERNNDTLLLCIQDDGIGMPLNPQSQPGHYGLIGMRERAAMVGASLSILSPPGQGTRITLKVPL